MTHPLLLTFSFAPLSLRRSQPRRYSTVPKISATIFIGDKLPNATLSYFDSSDVIQIISVSDLTSNKKTILLVVSGAFTPTYSQKHLLGFVDNAFVMKAWKENLKVGDEVLLLIDGNGDFTRAIWCELDWSDKLVSLGVRSRRYVMYVEDGVVKILNLEEGCAFNVSSTEDFLKAVLVI